MYIVQAEGLKSYQEAKRENMRSQIAKTIDRMRAEKITITKKSLAEELGITERAMYAPYITTFLQKFREFNPNLDSPVSPGDIESYQNEIRVLKAKVKELTVKNRELKMDVDDAKEKLHEFEEKYNHLLGQYYKDVSEKITYF